MATFPGLDKDKLEQFRTIANQNPKDITLDLEAKTTWDGHAVGHVGKIGPWSIGGKLNDTQARDYTTQFGMWKEVEETLGIPNPRDRTEAMEAALMGLASCVVPSSGLLWPGHHQGTWLHNHLAFSSKAIHRRSLLCP